MAAKLLSRRFWPHVTHLSKNLNYFKLNVDFSSPSQCLIFRNASSFFEKDQCTLFGQLQPERRLENVSKLLQDVPKRPFIFINGLPKSFFSLRKKKDKEPKNKRKRVPKLILVQNPLTWLMIKIDFSVLRNIWDPTFEEKQFKFGTKQAISRVTQVISQGEYSDLNGLLTKAARLSLLRELNRNWSDKQRSVLALEHEDIQISSPRKVYFIRIADKKFCDVDMAFLALKWVPINSIDSLIFTEIFARFHREYTPYCIPEWTIAYFKVTRFEIIRRSRYELLRLELEREINNETNPECYAELIENTATRSKYLESIEKVYLKAARQNGTTMFD